MGGIDVVLITLILPSTDTIFKWVMREGLEGTVRWCEDHLPWA